MEERVRGKGTYWELGPGYYQFRFSLGKDPETGKYLLSPKRTLHCKSKNKRGREAELRCAMEQYRQELNSGTVPTKPKPITVKQYAEQFHELREGTMHSELSYKREELDIKHIDELFGSYRVDTLTPLIIKKKYAQIRKEQRFSENELHKIHVKLSQIMKEAVRDELIIKNPCENISVPRPQPKERQSLSPKEASRLLHCLLSDYKRHKEDYEHRIPSLQALPHIIGTLLLLDTGMRRGEMLGLAWQYVNLEKGTVYICKQYAKDKKLRDPKSKSSKRHIYLSEGMTEILADWFKLQKTYFTHIGLKRTAEAPVVNNQRGSNMDPDNFNRWFRSWSVSNSFGSFSDEISEYYDAKGIKRYRKTGYSGISPHSLRHTMATLLISENVDIKTVQSRLGHSSVDLTLNIYSHAIEAKDKEAANVFSDLLEHS